MVVRFARHGSEFDLAEQLQHRVLYTAVEGPCK